MRDGYELETGQQMEVSIPTPYCRDTLNRIDMHDLREMKPQIGKVGFI